MNDRAECLDICRQHGLELQSFQEGASGASRYIACVRDHTGALFLLKQSMPDRQPAEVAALRAWDATGCAVRIVDELEGGAYLAEWLGGRSLAELAPSEPADFVAIGKMLGTLHDVTPLASLRDIRDRLSTSGWRQLPPELIALGEESAARALADPAPLVMLHGDLVPSNVMLTEAGPKVIDPFPGVGPPAWDIAQLAAASAGRGRRRVIRPLLHGYGSSPPLLSDMYAWMLLFFLERNLIAGRAEFSDNLMPVALELLRTGDPEAFLRSECEAA
ncbi:MAG: aminoglycoside phosphotransferase family protein [Dehalococcoidia bacterium]